MPKIKPFVWRKAKFDSTTFISETPFGKYWYYQIDDEFHIRFQDENIAVVKVESLAKRFAFDDFKRRLEETLGEPVGYDLPIDENC